MGDRWYSPPPERSLMYETAGVISAPPAGLECLQKKVFNEFQRRLLFENHPFPSYRKITNFIMILKNPQNQMEDRWYSPPSWKVIMMNCGCFDGTARWPGLLSIHGFFPLLHNSMEPVNPFLEKIRKKTWIRSEKTCHSWLYQKSRMIRNQHDTS